MPPKLSVARAAQDWTWVGTEVQSPADITPVHRRRAAGLAGPLAARPCVYKFDNLAHPQMVDSDATMSDASVVALAVRDKTCQPKKCKANPRCYNHLGGKEWLEDDCREKFVTINIGNGIKMRDGPAGLKNYGATCYANAFLQVWFNNVAFRNGVYEAANSTANALFHLANIFGMLQHSQRHVVDPGALIEALRLNKGYQQDAAEFSKLFMSLLSDEFRRAGAKTFVQDQFEGTLQYCTQCNTCGYTSTTDNAFLELEISLRDKTSLESRIAELLRPEALNGDNKYRCPQCDGLQPATRSTLLKSLPPVLHFSLMRFAYDPYSGSRKKSKASITYPRSLSLNGDKYELRGVVVHQGTSARHGHFVCEVFNEDDQQWYWCSDNEVTKLDDRPKKRAKVDPDESDEAQVKELSSKDAYMLVYKRFTVTNAVSRPAPETVMDAITADNTVLMDEVAGRESTLAALGHEFDHLATVKRDVLGSLPGNDCIVPAEALTAWLKSRDPNSEWDFSPLSCEHGSVSPDATASIKLISRTAFNKLSEYSTLTEMDVCPTCVEERFTSHTRKATHEEQVAEFDTLNDGSNGYVLPNAWLKAWHSGKLPTTDTSPTDPTYTLFCEHGKPGADIKGRVCISGDGLVLLRSIFGDFEAFETDAAACDQCAERAEASVQDRLAWAEAVRAERPIHRQQMNIFQVFDVKNYLLPKTFAEDWPKYLKNPTPRPTLDIERCPHGLLDFNPQLEPANYLTQSGWLDLCRLYRHNPSDCVSVNVCSNPPPGKKYPVDQVSLETCNECRSARLSDFGEMWLTIVKGRASLPDGAAGTNRRSSTRSKEWALLIKKNTTVKFIRTELYALTKVSPMRQRLFLRDKELDVDDTIESMGLLKGDHLALEEVTEVVDLVDVDDDEEGFGGTALIGRTACPQCTYSNEPGAQQCDMCEMPFC